MRARVRSLSIAGALSLSLGPFAAEVTAQATYEGVTPESDTVPENLPAAPGAAALVTWPGFQMMPGGGSRVFIQTSTPVAPALQRDGEGWQILLPGVALPAGNTRRPLSTQYFNTPVLSVRTVVRGHGVAVLLAMRAKLQPTVRTERSQSGYFYTFVEFPPGQYR
ncbi:MAG: hypothetical protein ABW252_02445 [Polyangiales bacterium]